MQHERVAPVAHQPLLVHLENGVPTVFTLEALDVSNIVALTSPMLLVDGQDIDDVVDGGLGLRDTLIDGKVAIYARNDHKLQVGHT